MDGRTPYFHPELVSALSVQTAHNLKQKAWATWHAQTYSLNRTAKWQIIVQWLITLNILSNNNKSPNSSSEESDKGDRIKKTKLSFLNRLSRNEFHVTNMTSQALLYSSLSIMKTSFFKLYMERSSISCKNHETGKMQGFQ